MDIGNAVSSLLVYFLLGSCTADVRMNCPRHFDVDFKGSCYFYSHDYETWTGALVSCQVLGGHLVEIETTDEFHFLQTQDTLHGDKRWIGLSNKRSDSEWEWATSNTVYDSNKFNMWGSGEPDNRKDTGDESCVVMDYFPTSSHNFTLADVNCISPQQRYICEYNPHSLPDFVGK